MMVLENCVMEKYDNYVIREPKVVCIDYHLPENVKKISPTVRLSING